MSFTLKKVLISEAVDPCCALILKNHGVQVDTKTGMKKDELLKEISTYDGLIVRSATKVTADVIAAGKELLVIGRAGTGVDNIDCNAATRHGVLVINSPGGNTLSAAELTCAMVVSLSRNIVEASASLKAGKWDRKSFMGNELFGKTLAIIGLGRIGREVAQRMQSFGMTTIGYDPLVPADASIQFGVQSFPLEELWPQADYITVHVPLIPQTKDLMNDNVFAKCKKGIKVVNCARGGIINEDALFRALESGQCSGAGLDVYPEEPPTNRKLVEHSKVICTPHLGASTVEAQNRVAEEVAQQFVDIMQGKCIPGIVNSPAFCTSVAEENRNWVALCQSLGAILGSLVSGNKTDLSLNVSLNGAELSGKQDLLKISALLGLLKQLKYHEANFINAPVLAKEAKIEASAANISFGSGEGNLPTSVMIAINSASATHNVIGSVRGKTPFLTAINGVGFEDPARLDSQLVMCRGIHGSKMTVLLLGALVKCGTIHSAHWSSTHENKSWCVVNGEFSVENKPKELEDLVDFWAQLVP